MEIYRLENVSFAFPEQPNRALSHIDLTIDEGQFVTVCGRSGCGKSTLLRQLKTVLTPHGQRSGEVYFRGRLLAEADLRMQASEIGFVLQSPDNQIVTDKVWHELAFGLESLGFDTRDIRIRVAEMASFFGIQTWFHKRVTELSGGQKQLLNLASIMAMHPSVLILDEPTSQLDPIAAAEFLHTIGKINRELGTTVIMTEHRLEEALPLSDRLIVLDGGTVIADGPPRKAGEALWAMGHPMFASMPAPMRVYAAVEKEERERGGGMRMPLTVKEGREWLTKRHAALTATAALASGRMTGEEDADERRTADCVDSNTQWGSGPGDAGSFSIAAADSCSSEIAVQFRDVWFKYDKNGPDIIKGLTFEVRTGQFYCLVGGNGTGKTTTLSLISGLARPYRGKVKVGGRSPVGLGAKELFVNRLGVLPQNPQSLFVMKTVELDLYEMLAGSKLTAEQKKAKVEQVVEFMELEPLLSSHPYDLSGGEQQRAALAKVLMLDPSILLLDEPTKGLDGHFKEKLGRFLRQLNEEGVTIVMVSHDIEFCAKHGEVCAMFFDGSMMTEDWTKPFFAGNSFYTTAANRMARHQWPHAVTTEDVIALCQGKHRS